MDLRGPIRGMYRYPTIVMLCEGRGIAAARALIEAGADEGGLSLPLRQDVRLYYRVRRHQAGSVVLKLHCMCKVALCWRALAD